jgi:hypothetical protein
VRTINTHVGHIHNEQAVSHKDAQIVHERARGKGFQSTIESRLCTPWKEVKGGGRG